LSILKVSIRQIKAARSLLAWSQERLAEECGVSIPTIKRLESEDGELGGRADTGAKIIAALQAAGVEFTNGGQPGVRMKKVAQNEEPRSLIGKRVRVEIENISGALVGTLLGPTQAVTFDPSYELRDDDGIKRVFPWQRSRVTELSSKFGFRPGRANLKTSGDE
jgi:transcriptional regulator with XRE-family HTH domain